MYLDFDKRRVRQMEYFKGMNVSRKHSEGRDEGHNYGKSTHEGVS